MKKLINAVRDAMSSKNWVAALFLSLTLPDICGALENPNEKNGRRYNSWCTKYLKHLDEPYNGRFSAKDCWQLRNACLHAGSDSNVKMTFEKIHFAEPIDT